MSNAPEPLPARPSGHRRNPRHLDVGSRRSPCSTCARIWELYNVQLPHLLRKQQQSPAWTAATTLAPHSVSTIHLTVRFRWQGLLLTTDPRSTILLFDQDGHPVVPTCLPLDSPRAAAVKHARRAPPKAARSVLDGREHGGIITADGRQVPEARAVYTRILTAANNADMLE